MAAVALAPGPIRIDYDIFKALSVPNFFDKVHDLDGGRGRDRKNVVKKMNIIYTVLYLFSNRLESTFIMQI